MNKTMPLQILSLEAAPLVTPCEPVKTFDMGLAEQLDQMFLTMKGAKGIGLAANQVGIMLSMFVMELQNGERRDIVNPRLVSKSDKIAGFQEGCLSLPGAFVDTGVRSEAVVIRYQDKTGADQIESFTQVDAVCVQHEMEHLMGESFLKHLGRQKRRLLLRKHL
jgi:peptide deformylase